MRTLFFIGLFILWSLSVSAQSSSTTLPNWLIDSLSFEVRLGRQCQLVTAAQALEIESLHKELNSYGVALKLSQSSNETLSGLLNNSRDGQEILALQFSKDLKEEKKKTRRWRRIGIIQVAVIVGIILVK